MGAFLVRLFPNHLKKYAQSKWKFFPQFSGWFPKNNATEPSWGHQIIIKPLKPPSSSSPHPPKKNNQTKRHTQNRNRFHHQPSRHIFLVHFIGRKVWTLEDREVTTVTTIRKAGGHATTTPLRLRRLKWGDLPLKPTCGFIHLRFCCRDDDQICQMLSFVGLDFVLHSEGRWFPNCIIQLQAASGTLRTGANVAWTP